MKKLVILFVLSSSILCANAQHQMRIWQGGEDTKKELKDMTFANGNISFADETLAISSIDSIVVVHEVNVQYNGSTATVNIPEALREYVSVSIDGANVTINNRYSNEVEFTLSGKSDNGSFRYTGDCKCALTLNGLNLTSKTANPINIMCGKRVAVVLNPGTENIIADAAGDQKGCFYCKGHVEIEGSGSLTVTGNAKHAISTKEYLQLKKGTGAITIAKAAADAIHCGQYFQMNGGTLTIDKNTLGDGIQVETLTLDDDETPDPSKENNGKIFVKGGSITATIISEDCKAIKCDNDIAISGGTFLLNANGNGTRGIQTDGNMVIGDGDNATSITVSAAGGKCTQTECSDDPHKCMGIKVDGNLTVNGGTTTVTNTGKKSKGIKVGGTYTKNGGTVNATIE